jgi:hypothetical protein
MFEGLLVVNDGTTSQKVDNGAWEEQLEWVEQG